MKIFISAIAVFFFNSICFGQISILTNIPPSIAPNSTLIIEVKITKGAIGNFSKYQMDVPQGVSVSENNSKTGNFTFEAGRAKIVWVSIPAEPEFIVSFNMYTGNTSGSGTFNQKFFYLENGAKQEVEADALNVTFDASGATVAAGLPESQNTASTPPATVAASTAAPVSTPAETVVIVVPEQTKPAEPVTTTETVPQTTTQASSTTFSETVTVSTPRVNPEPETKIEPVKSEPARVAATPVSNVVYKIQIGAFGSNPDKARFKTIGKVAISQEGGFYKALVGSFGTKEEALKKREELISKGFDGFVVAYKDGVRVK